jgi:FtsP/CotA-like multicopper oxidase with cupredoxin domain
VTQDAIPANGEYTYNFIAKQPGTYWYHSHQESEKETGKGLYGAFIVEPKQQAISYAREIVSILHQRDNSNPARNLRYSFCCQQSRHMDDALPHPKSRGFF